MKAVIIEDESLIARALQEKLRELAQDIEVVETLPSLKTARRWFMQNAEPDLMFMDVQLSDGMSFELFDYYNISCPVIFTTAYDEYAIRAFKVNGVDYLLKPLDDNDLLRAIEKCRKQVQAQTKMPLNLREVVQLLQQPASAQTLYKEKFIVNFRHVWLPISTNDIALFQRDNLNYLYTFNNEKHILDYATLEEIEDLLDPNIFYRANRQAIVHMNAIERVRLHENQKLTVHLKAPVKIEVDISREKAPAFKRWFDR